MRRIVTTRYKVQSKKIENQYKIAVLADLHMKTEEWRVKQIISIIETESPNYVLVAGDLITTYPAAYAGVREDFEWVAKIAEIIHHIAKVSRVFYIDGNHEIYLKKSLNNAYAGIYERYQTEIQEAGALIMHNENEMISSDLMLYGHEFSYGYYRRHGRVDVSVEEIVRTVGRPDKDTYTVLLTHDPTKFDVYSEWGADLVVSGHMHGGVVRIRNRGLFGADRRVFPRYCYGEYHKDDSTLIVTGGLGEHSIWKRMFNPPEIVIINLGW